MSFVDKENLVPADFAEAVAIQTPQLRENIIADVAINSPFANIIEGGTIANREGKEVRTLVTNRASPHFSQVRPVFQDDALVCGDKGGQDEYGQTEFTTKLETIRGRGPLVCVKSGRLTVKNSYLAAEQSLKNIITNLISVDIRVQMMDRSGVKFVANSTKKLDVMLAGGRNQVSTPFPGFLPDAAMSFKALIKLGEIMREQLRVPHFSSGGSQYYTVISSVAQNEKFRNESEFRDTILARTQGGFMEGVEAIEGYKFVDMIQRGFLFGTDQEPLRYNVLDNNGQPSLIEPTIEVDGDFGKDSIANIDWLNAEFEIGFLVAKDSFRRLVPEAFVGEGTFKFAPQLVMGELNWVFRLDNDENLHGDFGFHTYQVTRAYESVQPHAVIPFAYKRCEDDLGLLTCPDVSDSELVV